MTRVCHRSHETGLAAASASNPRLAVNAASTADRAAVSCASTRSSARSASACSAVVSPVASQVASQPSAADADPTASAALAGGRSWHIRHLPGTVVDTAGEPAATSGHGLESMYDNSPPD